MTDGQHPSGEVQTGGLHAVRVAAPARQPFVLDPAAKLYLWLTAIFVTCLLLANILGVKMFILGPYTLGGLTGPIEIKHTIGMLPFPITFILTDIVNEFYGRRAARRMTYIAFAMAALAFVLISIARAFPIDTSIPNTATPEAFDNIFAASANMYVASIIAFLCGSLLDIFIFGVLKRATGGRYVWLRATGSTVVSQVFDSLLVTILFFSVIPGLLGQDVTDFREVLRIAMTGYILKFFIAIALTPAIYLGRWLIRTQYRLQPVPIEP